MLRHFGIADPEGARLWRTITPAALPQDISRWRINPSRLRESSKQKSGAERKQEEERAAGAVFQALRHVGIGTRVEAIRVQREPFERKGERAEAFALETRFAKERLWHAEIAFAEPVRGPLVIGDGRYLGLGVMVPLRENWRDVIIFVLPAEANIDLAEGPALLHATRRALMALSGEVTGHVPRLFSGHEENGRPAASGQHKHVFLAAHDSGGDGRIDRIVVAAPWVCDRSMQPHRSMRKAFDEVVSRLEAVRAGRLGVIALGQSVSFLGDEPLIGPARVWESLTPYRATRHAGRRKEPEAALVRDLITECTRRSLPKPEVDILEFWAVATGGGLTARVRLRFAVAVRGPLLLGRDSHRGGGFFKLLC